MSNEAEEVQDTDDSVSTSTTAHATSLESNPMKSLISYPSTATEHKSRIEALLGDIHASTEGTKSTLTTFESEVDPLMQEQLKRLNAYTQRITDIRSGIYDVYIRLRRCRADLIEKGHGIPGVEDPVDRIEREADEEFQQRREQKLKELAQRQLAEKEAAALAAPLSGDDAEAPGEDGLPSSSSGSSK
jgi:hypothetical protein